MVGCGFPGPVDAVFRGEQRELVLLHGVEGRGVSGGQPRDDFPGEEPAPDGDSCPGAGDVSEVGVIGAVTAQQEDEDIG